MPDAESLANLALSRLRQATTGTPYEGKLHLVGGLLRDRALGQPIGNDLDLVLEGDAVQLALFLYERGLSQHYPVTYPRFGTAMIHVGMPGEPGSAVELVSARTESYHADSRKPDVRQGTLHDDVLRRDFTINTLLRNLHTGAMLDLTGRAYADLSAGIIRTPLEPRVTFFDDPLRMLRAVRFATRFQFKIEASTWQAICDEAERLRPPAIAHERIREEFVKIARLPGRRFRVGMELLRESGLLDKFLVEMRLLIGCQSNSEQREDVWTETLDALERLPDTARLEIRLALLWHGLGKPLTQTFGDDGQPRFPDYARVSADTARRVMMHLKFANDEIHDVTFLIEKQERLLHCGPDGANPDLKRLVRELDPYLDDLFVLARCLVENTDSRTTPRRTLDALHARLADIIARYDPVHIVSPLDGNEIQQAIDARPGPWLRDAKQFLMDAVLDEILSPDDKPAALALLLHWWNDGPRR